MYLHGSFIDREGQRVTVEIVTGGTRTPDVEIGTEEGGVWFQSADAVVIESSVNDTRDVLLRHSCTIRLLTRDYLGGLFCRNCRDAVVNVKRGGSLVFAGYLEPQVYEQGYNNELDELELNCVDALSALQYRNYKGIGESASYATVKREAGQCSFREILNEMLNEVTTGLNLDSPESPLPIWYDGSMALSSETVGDRYDTLNHLQVSTLLFLGDGEDDVWTEDVIAEELLRWLNLHVVEDSGALWIFNWDTVKNGGSTSWHQLNGGGTTSTTGTNQEITLANVADTDTTLSVCEVKNQVIVTCEREEVETLIDDPLDGDSLVSKFDCKQKYMTEYISEGSGDDANDAFNAMVVRDESTDYKDAKVYEWYMQVMENPSWKLYYKENGTRKELPELYDHSGNTFINQDKVTRWLKSHTLVPCFLRFGSVEKGNGQSDNSPVSSIETKDYLYISVNGNEVDDDQGSQPGEAAIQGCMPLAEFVKNTGGAVFSPADGETTNYLVFSGKIRLQPIVYESTPNAPASRAANQYAAIKASGCHKTEGDDAECPSYDGTTPRISNLVKSDHNGEGRYYTRKFWTVENPKTPPTNYYTNGEAGVQPWTEDKSAKGYAYNYTQTADETGEAVDHFSKVPVLACELIIGDKRCIETDIDDYGNSTFRWVPVDAWDDENSPYKGQKYFTLGFNPKIGDCIIGEEYDLQNTIDYTMGLDVDGTAIPMTADDHLSGNVTFRIVGPVNLVWNDVVRRHPSFWRHTKWFTNSRSILAHVENIIIESFSCGVYSDNGLQGSTASDLVFMSDTDEGWVNKMDDVTLRLSSGLTTAESKELGAREMVCLGTVQENVNEAAVTKVYDCLNGEEAKAEKLLVDALYREWHEPRILLKQTLRDKGVTVSQWNLYMHPALGKTFYVQGLSRNLMSGEATLVMKEMW